MVESGASPTPGQLVDFLAGFVADRFRKTGRGVTGAVLAEELRGHFSDLDLTSQFGDHWLGELTRLGETEGKVVRNRNVKHLEVYPPSAEPITLADSSSAMGNVSHRLYVRSELWRAFVFVTKADPVYFDRRTFRVVRSTSVVRPTDDNLCAIDRIPATEQQTWMREFVESNNSLLIEDAPIEQEYWWVKFSQWLRQTSPETEIQWRKFRSAKVVDRVREWAKKNGINAESVLSPVKMTSTRAVAERGSGSTTDDQSGDDAAIRLAIIAAVREMPLEDLKNLTIPVRYMLRHFNAR